MSMYLLPTGLTVHLKRLPRAVHARMGLAKARVSLGWHAGLLARMMPRTKLIELSRWLLLLLLLRRLQVIHHLIWWWRHHTGRGAASHLLLLIERHHVYAAATLRRGSPWCGGCRRGGRPLACRVVEWVRRRQILRLRNGHWGLIHTDYSINLNRE